MERRTPFQSYGSHSIYGNVPPPPPLASSPQGSPQGRTWSQDLPLPPPPPPQPMTPSSPVSSTFPAPPPEVFMRTPLYQEITHSNQRGIISNKPMTQRAHHQPLLQGQYMNSSSLHQGTSSFDGNGFKPQPVHHMVQSVPESRSRFETVSNLTSNPSYPKQGHFSHLYSNVTQKGTNNPMMTQSGYQNTMSNVPLNNNNDYDGQRKDQWMVSAAAYHPSYNPRGNTPVYANVRPSPLYDPTIVDNNAVYETIGNDRPSSQMSTFSNVSGASSLYSASNLYSSHHKPQPPPPPHQVTKHHPHPQPLPHPQPSAENEVDELTDLLVKSMGNSNDPDFFGICFLCKHKVLGEGNGCTAMGQIYHIKCFTCKVCHQELRGLPFYNVDGNPHCQQDYLNTLEKCCVCKQPILDRILRATGKPYHPNCFTCIVCGKCLDGIPFTVDNINRIHCIEDFHKKFAPRCCVCAHPILPEPGQQETVRVVALDRSYHVNCYRCQDCKVQLTSVEEGTGCYPLDHHILCKSCNINRVNQLT